MLDQVAGWTAYARLHAVEENPRRKAMLANIMEHYKWEVLGEPDRLLEGVHPDAVYSFYGFGGEAIVMKGHDEIRPFYQHMAETGANVLQQDVDHLLLNDEVISGHGVWHQVQPGRDLLGGGTATSDVVVDPDGRYLISQRYAWFLPYSDDEVPMLMGEIVYFHPPLLSIRKLAPGEEVFGKLTEDMFVLEG